MNLENRMLLDSMKWDTSHAGLRLQEHKLAFPGRRLILSCFISQGCGRNPELSAHISTRISIVPDFKELVPIPRKSDPVLIFLLVNEIYLDCSMCDPLSPSALIAKSPSTSYYRCLHGVGVVTPVTASALRMQPMEGFVLSVSLCGPESDLYPSTLVFRGEREPCASRSQ